MPKLEDTHTMIVWPIWLQHNWRQWDFHEDFAVGGLDAVDRSEIVRGYEAFQCAGSVKKVEIAARLPAQAKVISIAVGIRCLEVCRRVRSFLGVVLSMKPRRLEWVFCWEKSRLWGRVMPK
jgi:hypothetical protein